MTQPTTGTPRAWPDGTAPTDRQRAVWLLGCTDQEREEYVTHAHRAFDRGQRCLLENHDGRLVQAAQHPAPRLWWTPTGIAHEVPDRQGPYGVTVRQFIPTDSALFPANALDWWVQRPTATRWSEP